MIERIVRPDVTILEHRFKGQLLVEPAEALHDRIRDQHVAVAPALARPGRSRDPRIGKPADMVEGVKERADEVGFALLVDQGEQRVERPDMSF